MSPRKLLPRCILPQCPFYAYHANTNVRSLIQVISNYFKTRYPQQAPLFTKNGMTFVRTSTPFVSNDGGRHPDYAHYPTFLGM